MSSRASSWLLFKWESAAASASWARLPNSSSWVLLSLCMAKVGRWRWHSSASFLPSSPSQSLGTPSRHSSWRPSIVSSKLWRAQHVSHVRSAATVPSSLIPVLRMRQRPFKIPKKHSISFLKDSIHSERRCSVSRWFTFAGAWVQAQRWYPLSTRPQAPRYFTLTTSSKLPAFPPYFNNSKRTSWRNFPSWIPERKSSKRARVLSFQRLGWPFVE